MSAEEASTSPKEVVPESDAQPHTEECECKMNEIENQSSLEAQKALLWQALPLVLLILISILVQNIISILIFIALIATFDTINDFVIRQSERSRGLSKWKIAILLLYLASCLCLSFPVVRTHWLFSINPPRRSWLWDHGSFWSRIYLVTVIDFLFKYLTMLVKCVILLLSGTVLPVHRRGKTYMVCEGLSQIFRCLLPIPEWSKYIISYQFGLSRIVCWLLLIMYIVLKLKTVKNKLSLLINIMRHKTVTGTKLQPAVAEDISALPDTRICPICHDPFVHPVKLPCGHVYCLDCVSIWFDRERHCPFCSSTAINSIILGFQSALSPVAQYTSSNRKWKTGATDYVIQFF